MNVVNLTISSTQQNRPNLVQASGKITSPPNDKHRYSGALYRKRECYQKHFCAGLVEEIHGNVTKAAASCCESKVIGNLLDQLHRFEVFPSRKVATRVLRSLLRRTPNTKVGLMLLNPPAWCAVSNRVTLTQSLTRYESSPAS